MRLRPVVPKQGGFIGIGNRRVLVPKIEDAPFAFNFLVSANPSRGSGSTTISTSENGTYVASSGLIVQNTANNPRIDYNPATLQVRGLLVEEARTNLCLQSADLATTWTSTRATVSANAAAGPDGASTADKLVEDGTAANSHFNQQAFTKAASALPYSYSIFAKAVERSFERIQVLDGVSNGAYADVSVAAGSISVGFGIGGTPFTSLSAAIYPFSNSWQRPALNFTTGTDAALTVFNVLANALAGVSYNGDSTSGMLFVGGQLEQAAFPSSYIPTAAASVTRAKDSYSIAFTQNSGTFVFEGITAPGPGTQYFLSIDDGTANNRIAIYRDSSNQIHCLVVTGAATQCDINLGTVANLTQFRVAFSCSASGFSASLNGAAEAPPVAAGTLPTVTTANLGQDHAAANQCCGWLRKLSWFPAAFAGRLAALSRSA